MRALVTCERRFKRTPDGRVWTTSTDDYSFWKRYLGVFEEVIVLSRVEDVVDRSAAWKAVEGHGLEVAALPNYLGPTGYLWKRTTVRAIARVVADSADVAVLRVPSHVAVGLAPTLRQNRSPFGVEVVGDPYEAFAPKAIGHPLSPLLRAQLCRHLRRLCLEADAVSYVTETTLQKRYPPNPRAFTTYYSSLDLPHSALAATPKTPPPPGGPFTVASVGSMELMFKGFGDLIAASARCLAQGVNVRLLLIGGGRRAEDVIGWAKKAGLEGRVTFTGELPGSEHVLQALRAADLFVLASRTEGLPRVTIEAMSQGLPCLGSRVGGTLEILPMDCTFAPGDVDALAAKITWASREPRALAAMASANLLRAADFIASRLQPRREELYRHLRCCAERAVGRNTNYFVLSDGMLGLRTNLRKFRWSYGQNAPRAGVREFESCTVRLELLVQPSRVLDVDSRGRGDGVSGRYSFVTAAAGMDQVLYSRPLLPGGRLLLQARRLLGEYPQLRINRNYLRFVHFRFMNLHSAAYVLTDLATLLLLRKGYAALHCSAFRLAGRTILVFGPSKTGKTLTAMRTCVEYGADLVSEDLAITDGETVYGVPWTNTFRYYSGTDQPLSSRVLAHLARYIPLFELAGGLATPVPITEFIPNERICATSHVTDIVVLERGADQVEPLDVPILTQKIENLNRAEFNYRRSLLTNAHDYFNPALDVRGQEEKERNILRRLAERAERRLLIRAANPIDYTALVLKAVFGETQLPCGR
jgi:glycosyltransferase involved in cell wall biosynthesis